VNGRPVAISDEAMAALFDLARPLDPRDRTRFVESVVADLNGHAEIDLGLIHRIAVPLQRQYLGVARGAASKSKTGFPSVNKGNEFQNVGASVQGRYLRIVRQR
jgi:hypothetical protein